MYLCLQCGGLFEIPYKYKEKHGFNNPPYEEVNCCPYCKADYIQTFKCEECGEWISSNTYYKINNNKYCDECCVKCNLE